MPLLTAKELALELHVNEKDVYRKAQSGELPSYKIGKSRRFDLAEVLRAVRDHVPSPRVVREVGRR